MTLSYFIDFLQVVVGSVAIYLSVIALRRFPNGAFRAFMWLYCAIGVTMLASAAVALSPRSVREVVRLAKTVVVVAAVANVNRYILKP